jgi:hypothetical protein
LTTSNQWRFASAGGFIWADIKLIPALRKTKQKIPGQRPMMAPSEDRESL